VPADTERLTLDADVDAVPCARRFVTAALAGTDAADLAVDAELVVSELVTNAILHAGAPVDVSLAVAGRTVRIEVRDPVRVSPVRGLAGADAMTGRGLGLVAALTSGWGTEPRGDGKVVWAELSLDAPLAAAPTEPTDVDALLAAWDEGPEPEPRYPIRLGDVPTSLLLAAKAHVDNVVREFTLAARGAASGRTAQVPPHLAALIDSVTTRFAEARQEIKRQAIAAAATGSPRTTLVLHLPLSAAEAGEEYLAALDEADTYARAARLLTLATPPQHRAFRRWYVEAIIDQLRRAERGEAPTDPPSFEEHLLTEFAAVSEARRASDRAARLQVVTAALGSTTTPEEVAAVVVSEGVAALEASGGSLLVPTDDEHLGSPGAVGYGEELVQFLRSERRDAALPGAEALRTGRPVWIESRQERDERFPELTGLEPRTVSMCALPLNAGGRLVGALRFSFDAQRLFDEDERRFALALAAQTAQALERGTLYADERAARDAAELAAERLRRLQAVTTALAVASTVEDVADAVVDQAMALLGARIASFSVTVDAETMQLVRMRGSRTESAAKWGTYPLSAELPASVAARTGEPIVLRGLAEINERFPLVDVVDDQVLVCVPMSVAASPVGALSVSFPTERPFDDADLALLMTVGRQCALALSRVRLFESERLARSRTAYLADATEVLMSSLEPEETVAHLTDLLVPSLADWAVVYLVDPESGAPVPTAVAHRDPAVGDTMRGLVMSVPLDTEARDGVAEVLRTGTNIRYGEVPDAVRARAAGGFEEPAARDAVEPLTGMCVALRGGDGVLGAIALARIDGAIYTDADLALAELVADRASVAVLNAQRFSRERDAAVTLQRSLLPQTLPRLPGMTFAWRYLPGGAAVHVGGDWYDVIPLADGGVGLVIGDVMGRGVHAAAIMGQLRATARAYAAADLPPADVLARLDEAVSGLEQGQITTALYGVLDPRSGALTLSSAGHLPPLLVPVLGEPEYLAVEPGPPLGVGGPYAQHTVTVPRGATLLLFTDGLVESRVRPVDVGMEALRAAARGLSEPEDLCEKALVALGRDNAHDDDTAMLAVRLDG
jgi:serine phosphatase RsbU (regulator of sigma subunit)/anti-sigma regulatory factor (Ser/Thr protein kinase)